MREIYTLILFICLAINSNAQSIAGGYYHTLTVCEDSTVMAFGGNFTGQLGNGTSSPSSIPVSVSGASFIVAVSAGDNFSMALKSDGTVLTWGNNNSGQLGDGTFIESNVPVLVSGLTGVVSISAGGSHAIAAKDDGTLWTWGVNNSGQAGDGTAGNSSNVPTIVTGSTDFIKVAAGGNHNIALKSDGTVWAMGAGTVGVLGTGTNSSSFVPVQSNTLPGVIDIASGQSTAYAINADSTVSAWGYGVNGQLGNGVNISSLSPVLVNSLTQITHLASGFGLHAMGRKVDGTLWVWGHNDYGQLGDGTNTSNNSPVQLMAPVDMFQVALGNVHSIATKSDGSTWTWGSNSAGQIGNGTTVDTNVPAQVAGLCNVKNPDFTGISELKSKLITLYPNPASSVLNINNGVLEIDEVQIIDLSGKTIRIESFHTQIDISSLSRGIFFIKLISDEGVFTERFIKQ